MTGATIHLRAMTADDLPAAHRLSMAVSWPHRPEDWRMLADLGCGVTAASGDGEVVGTAMWWPFGVAAATLGMIIVSPLRQGQGIGRRLMEALLDAAGPRPLMLNATEAGLPLYETYGFRAVSIVHQRQGQYAGAAGSARARAMTPADLDAVAALDAAAFGVARPAVLQRLLSDGGGVVLDGPDGPVGFAIRRPFGRGRVVGPVVAASETDAIELVRAAALPGFLRLDIDAAAASLEGWLRDVGLETVYPVTTMVRGDWPATAPKAVRYALVSQALG